MRLFLDILLFGGVLGGNRILATAQCFNPNGSAITDPAYQPCNQFTGTISQCCGTNHTGGVVAPDKCLPNGLCQNTGDLVYWRNGCTDRTFKSPFCLNICLDSAPGGSSEENVPIKSCSDGTWCCARRNNRCCETTSLRFALAATIGVSSTTSSAISTTTSSSTSTTQSTPPATTSGQNLPSNTAPPPNSGGDRGLSSGAKIGMAVGITVGVLALAIIIGIFMYLRRRDMQRFERLMQGHHGPPQSEGELANLNNAGLDPRFEVDGKGRISEVQGSGTPRYELHG